MKPVSCRRAVVCGGLVVSLLALPARAGAVDVIGEDFDSLSAGQSVSSQIPGVQVVPTATVFVPPTSGASRTFSPPHALRHPLNCNSPSCSNGAYRLTFVFARKASKVTMRVGDTLVGCFEFDCPQARLVGYDDCFTDPDPVADSGVHNIPSGSASETDRRISELLIAETGASFSIGCVRLFVGVDEEYDEFFPNPRPAQIDNFEVTILSESEPPPPDPLPEPPPPTIEITNPVADTQLVTPEAFVSGRLTATPDVSAFCVVANHTGGFPSRCLDLPRLEAGDSPGERVFDDVWIRGLRSGANTLAAWVRDTRGRERSASVAVYVLTPEDGIDIQPTGIDVTQGIQVTRTNFPLRGELPGGLGTAPIQAYPAIYGPGGGTVEEAYARYATGVHLMRSKTTIVRMQAWVAPVSEATPSTIRNVTATLRGFFRRDGRWRELDGGPLVAGPMDLSFALPFEQRADPSLSYTFTLPEAWTRARHAFLVGSVNPVGLSPRIPECSTCNDNNLLGLSGLRFRDPPPRHTIVPLSLFTTNPPPPAPAPPLPGQVYAEFRRIVPFTLSVQNYRAAIDVTGIVNRTTGRARGRELREVVEDWEDDNEIITDTRKVIGLQVGLDAGLAQDDVDVLGFDVSEGVAEADANRPLTSAAHEFMHVIGFEHAGRKTSCYPGQLGQRPPNDWPDGDSSGDILGWGLDPLPGSGATGVPRTFQGPFWVFGGTGSLDFIPPAALPQPTRYYDLMSYCVNVGGDVTGNRATDDVWLSTINWNLLAGGRRLGRDQPRSAARPRTLAIAGHLDAGGAVTIDRVEPGPGTPDRFAGLAFHTIETLDAAGRVIDSSPLQLRGSSDAPDGEPPSFEAELRSRGAMRVRVRVGSTTVAERSRSAHAPQVTVRRPGGGRVGGRGFVSLRWRASDRDGDRLSFAVDYSADGGRSWRPISVGIRRRQVRLPAKLLNASRRARIRVRANDGFNEAAGVSPRFSAAGVPPEVTIFSLARRNRIDGSDLLALEGQAYDDRGRRIRDRALRWRSAGHTVARGERAVLPAALLGRRLTLEATDYLGRTGRRSATLLIERPRPLFLKLRAQRLTRRARTLRLTVASTVPARLLITGRGVERTRAAVFRRPRNVRMQVSSGRTLRLRAILKARGKATAVFLRVRRR